MKRLVVGIMLFAWVGRRSTDFVIITSAELLKRLDAIHGKQKTVQS